MSVNYSHQFVAVRFKYNPLIFISMLEKALDFVEESLIDIDQLGPTLIGPELLKIAEQGLSLIGYEKLPAENHGGRILNSPLRGNFEGIDLLAGITHLNVREPGCKENLNAFALIYLGDSYMKNELAVGVMNSREAGMALLISNGVVSGSYLSSGKALSVPWHPEGKRPLGIIPHPEHKFEVLNLFTDVVKYSHLPIDVNSKTFKALSSLVMLAVNCYKAARIDSVNQEDIDVN